MSKSLLVISVLFLCTNLLPQSIQKLNDQIDTVQKNINILNEEVSSQKSKYPEFLIYGEIVDRGLYYIMVKGSALPVNEDFSLPGTVDNGYMLILNPDKEKINYNFYSKTKHYFLFKSYSKNAFNADVPVYNFGDLPGDTKKLIEEKENKLRILEEKKNYLSQTLKEKKKEEFLNEAKVYTNETKYIEAMDKLKQAAKLFPNDKEVNKQFYKNAIEQVKIDTSKGEYETALSLTNEGFEIGNLKPAELNTLKYLYSDICIKEADKNYLSGDYARAIDYYQKSQQYGKEKLGRVETNFADAYFIIGRAEIEKGNVKAAKDNFKSSFKINHKNEERILRELEKYKRNPITTGLTSLIPGLGQLIQGETKSGFTQFSLFAGTMLFGYISKAKADDQYNEYLKATDVDKETQYYDEANRKLITSYTALSVGAAIIIYSVIDSYFIAIEHNKPFEIDIHSSQSSAGSFNNSFNVAFKIYF